MKSTILALAALLAVGCNESSATKTAPESTPGQVKVTVTAPSKPSTATADGAITADIRKQLIEGRLSASARSVTVTTEKGKVVLQGSVETESDKSQVERIADKVAGADNVTNELLVSQQ